MGFPGDTVVKNLPANVGDVDLIPGPARFPEEGNGNHSSILAWEIHGQESMVGYSPWGGKESDTTWCLNNNKYKIQGRQGSLQNLFWFPKVMVSFWPFFQSLLSYLRYPVSPYVKQIIKTLDTMFNIKRKINELTSNKELTWRHPPCYHAFSPIEKRWPHQ